MIRPLQYILCVHGLVRIEAAGHSQIYKEISTKIGWEIVTLVGLHPVTFSIWEVEQSVGHQKDSPLLRYPAAKQDMRQTQATKEAVWFKLLLQKLNTTGPVENTGKPSTNPRYALSSFILKMKAPLHFRKTSKHMLEASILIFNSTTCWDAGPWRRQDRSAWTISA